MEREEMMGTKVLLRFDLNTEEFIESFMWSLSMNLPSTGKGILEVVFVSLLDFL